MLQMKHGLGLFIASFMMMLVLIASPAHVSAATITTYGMPSIYSASTTYSLKADSNVIPVVGYTGNYDYAHFSMSGGPVTIEVTALGQSSITSYNISPKKLNLSGTISGNKLTFTLANDEYVIVKVNSSKELIIAADPAETNKPASSGTGIYNVKSTTYNADSTGTTLATSAIQSAINDANAYTGGQGIVYVPAGVYKVGNLQLKSDVALYLEGGAVLRFTGIPAIIQLIGIKIPKIAMSHGGFIRRMARVISRFTGVERLMETVKLRQRTISATILSYRSTLAILPWTD